MRVRATGELFFVCVSRHSILNFLSVIVCHGAESPRSRRHPPSLGGEGNTDEEGGSLSSI